MSVSCCLGGQGCSSKRDSRCKSSSKHKVTEEVNFQFARRISHVATGAMLAAAPHMVASPQKEKFAEVVEMCLNEAHGNVSAVSRKLRASRRTIRDWRQGTQVPQL